MLWLLLTIFFLLAIILGGGVGNGGPVGLPFEDGPEEVEDE